MKIQGKLIKATFLFRPLIFSRRVGRSDNDGGIINWPLTQPPTTYCESFFAKSYASKKNAMDNTVLHYQALNNTNGLASGTHTPRNRQ